MDRMFEIGMKVVLPFPTSTFTHWSPTSCSVPYHCPASPTITKLTRWPMYAFTNESGMSPPSPIKAPIQRNGPNLLQLILQTQQFCVYLRLDSRFLLRGTQEPARVRFRGSEHFHQAYRRDRNEE